MKKSSRKTGEQALPVTDERSKGARGAVDRKLTDEELENITGGMSSGGPSASIDWGDGRKKPT